MNNSTYYKKVIKGFYSGSYEMPISFSNWDNFDKILDLLDDYIELKEQITEGVKYDKNFYKHILWGI